MFEKSLGWGLLALFVAGCGVTDGEPAGSEPLGSVKQEGRTAQGRTAQGRTAQGRTAQGSNASVQRIDKFLAQVPNGFLGTTTIDSYDKAAVVGSKLRFLVPTLVFSRDGTSGRGVTNRWVDAPVGTQMNTWAAWTGQGELHIPVRISAIRTELSDANNPVNLTQGRVTDTLTQYALEVSQGDGTWTPLCNGEEGNWGMFTEGYWSNADKFDNYMIENAPMNRNFGFSCLDGTSAKCIRWGYMPWKNLPPPNNPTAAPVSLLPLYQSCVHAAMADYCGTLTSYTNDGTWVDLWDVYGFVRKTSEYEDIPGFSAESAWNEAGALCVEKARWESLGLACEEPYIVQYPCYGSNCPPGSHKPRLIYTNASFQEGQRSTCVANQIINYSRQTLLYVDSRTTYCPFSPYGSTGTGSPRPLRKDCNFCTTRVCNQAGYESCCTYNWSPACATKASQVCNTIVVDPGPILEGNLGSF